jgi:hypothetical protein
MKCPFIHILTPFFRVGNIFFKYNKLFPTENFNFNCFANHNFPSNAKDYIILYNGTTNFAKKSYILGRR